MQAAIDDETSYNRALQNNGDVAKSWVTTALSGVKVSEHLGGEIMKSVVTGGAGAVANGAVDRLIESQQQNGAKDTGLYTSAKDLYAMRYSVNQQTQWSTADALARHHVHMPEDANDVVRNAVNAGWDASSEYLSNTKERP